MTTDTIDAQTECKTVAFLVAPEGIEHAELDQPWNAVQDAGHQPVLLSFEEGQVQTFNHLDKATTYPVDRLVQDASVDEFEALVLPGGVANPDALRMDEASVAFVKAFMEAGKPVAAICHAPWTLIEAGCVEGRELASWPSLQTDIRNAGGTWKDVPVSVDGNLITSRNPDDLDHFNSALLEAIHHGAASNTEVTD